MLHKPNIISQLAILRNPCKCLLKCLKISSRSGSQFTRNAHAIYEHLKNRRELDNDYTSAIKITCNKKDNM
jgi:hypothetical protein